MLRAAVTAGGNRRGREALKYSAGDECRGQSVNGQDQKPQIGENGNANNDRLVQTAGPAHQISGLEGARQNEVTDKSGGIGDDAFAVTEKEITVKNML